MWLPPKSSGTPETWAEWLDSWAMWVQQVGMNIWYGRGGLNVKVSKLSHIVCPVLAPWQGPQSYEWHLFCYVIAVVLCFMGHCPYGLQTTCWYLGRILLLSQMRL